MNNNSLTSSLVILGFHNKQNIPYYVVNSQAKQLTRDNFNDCYTASFNFLQDQESIFCVMKKTQLGNEM